MKTTSRFLLAGVLGGAVAVTTQHQAQAASGVEGAEDPLELEWRAPEGCPNGAVVRVRVSVHAAPTGGPGGVEPHALRASAIVSADGDGFQLHLHLRGEDGVAEHRLESSDCAVLAEAAAFMMAVAMDPISKALAGVGGSSDDSEGLAEPPAEPSGSPNNSSSPAQGFLLVGGGAALGLLSPASGQLRVSAGARLRHARIGADARFGLPARRALALDDLPDAAIELSMWTAGAHACLVAPSLSAGSVGSVELPICVGVEVGLFKGRASGIPTPRDDGRLWVASSFGPGLMWSPLPWFAAGGAVELVIAHVRPAFSIGGVGRVYRAPMTSGRAMLLVEFRLSGG